jgi:hypothetical protein
LLAAVLDEDYVILSTIHSAKGQEWRMVRLLNVVDGCIRSDMATRTPEELEEERRLCLGVTSAVVGNVGNWHSAASRDVRIHGKYWRVSGPYGGVFGTAAPRAKGVIRDSRIER